MQLSCDVCNVGRALEPDPVIQLEEEGVAVVVEEGWRAGLNAGTLERHGYGKSQMGMQILT